MTRLPPNCSNGGTTETGIGYAEDPRTNWVVCLPCALPNKDQRERVTSEAEAELLRCIERENGRRPMSLEELAEVGTGQDAYSEDRRPHRLTTHPAGAPTKGADAGTGQRQVVNVSQVFEKSRYPSK